MQYLDFDLELLDHRPAAAGQKESFRVRVLTSPAGEQRLDAAAEVEVPTRLRTQLTALEERRLDAEGIRDLGEALGDLLLPPSARSYFHRSLERLQDDEGLRLRLRLQHWALADLPWEMAWVPPPNMPQGQGDALGFLALHRHLSIVRREVLGQAPGQLTPVEGRSPRLLALFSAPSDEAPLALERERDILLPALKEVDELEVVVEEHATRVRLTDHLDSGLHILHYAGHGDFEEIPSFDGGAVESRGRLILEGDDGLAAPISAEQLAVELSGSGLRLAVLGSCEGARRDGQNAWTGVAAALTRHGIPAVVAMQYDILDAAALAFSRRFYRVLAATGSVDAATTAGRREIYSELPEHRDFIGPVLYLRAPDGQIFPTPGADGEEESTAASENSLPAAPVDPEPEPKEATAPSFPLTPASLTNLFLVATAAATAAIGWQRHLLPRLGTWPSWGLLAFALAAAGGLVWWLAGGSIRALLVRQLENRRASAGLLVALVVLVTAVAAVPAPPQILVHVLPYAALDRLLPSTETAPDCTVTVRVSTGEDTYEVEDFRRGSLVIGGGALDYRRLRADYDPVGTYANIISSLGEPLPAQALEHLNTTWLPPRFLPGPRLGSNDSLAVSFLQSCPGQPQVPLTEAQRSLSDLPPPLPADFEEGAVKLWYIR